MARGYHERSTCLECKRGKTYARNICKTCYRNIEIRNRYSTNVIRARNLTLDSSVLSKPLPDKCEHGIPDGECATCEATQRAKIVVEEYNPGHRVSGKRSGIKVCKTPPALSSRMKRVM